MISPQDQAGQLANRIVSGQTSSDVSSATMPKLCQVVPVHHTSGIKFTLSRRHNIDPRPKTSYFDTSTPSHEDPMCVETARSVGIGNGPTPCENGQYSAQLSWVPDASSSLQRTAAHCRVAVIVITTTTTITTGLGAMEPFTM
ncbi:hypothetical protein GGS24DRAFT_503793 [Hypoxylon argillaceum]|nr:hypothetical protein GGS24DRAFT_503793 [Hypoxylon argillaceum]